MRNREREKQRERKKRDGCRMVQKHQQYPAFSLVQGCGSRVRWHREPCFHSSAAPTSRPSAASVAPLIQPQRGRQTVKLLPGYRGSYLQSSPSCVEASIQHGLTSSDEYGPPEPVSVIIHGSLLTRARCCLLLHCYVYYLRS
jgi:hypothetical protein